MHPNPTSQWLPNAERLARVWARALAGTSFVPLNRRELHTYLTEQCVRLMGVLAAGDADLRPAREVGAALVTTHFTQPASLAGTLTVLGEQFRHAPAPRLNAVLAELAAGYVEALSEHILSQQEQLRAAALQARSQAERARWAREARFRMVFAACPHAVIVADTEGRILNVNQALCDLLGHTAQEIGQLGAGGVAGAADPSLRSAYQELIRTGRRELRLHQQYRRKDGQQIWTEVTVAVARDDAGDPQYIIAMIEPS